jgi:hypothetical protein
MNPHQSPEPSSPFLSPHPEPPLSAPSRFLFLASAALSTLQWHTRPDGKIYDTLKPLAANGLDLGNTLLVDNHRRKAARGEELNWVVLPTWEECGGEGEGRGGGG